MDAIQNSLIYQGAQQTHPVRAARESGPIQDVEPVPPVDEVKKAPVYDVYVEGEQKEAPIGLYEVGVDEEGNPKILFDDPEKAEKADESGAPEDRSAPGAGDSERCTTNTDAVDREINRLKKEKEALEQQIQSATDESDRARLEQKLAALDMELSQKDSDAYRKQHATYTFS